MNPSQFINQVIQNSQLMQNPIIKNSYELWQKNDIAGLTEIANNACAKNGKTLQEMKEEVQKKYRF